MDSPPQATQASSVDTTAYVLPPRYDAQMKVLQTRIAELKTLLDTFTSSFRSSTSTTGISLPHGLQKRLVETIPTILGSLQLEVKAFSQRVSDGKIDITETLIQNPDDDKPDEIIRSSYLTHQNHDKISPPEVGPSSSTSAILKPRASSDQADDKPIRSSAGKSNMIADEDYNIVLEFEPEDKSKKRFKVVLTPNDNIHRALPPATTAPLGMKIITKWRDAVDPDISRDNKGKKRQMDSDVAELDIDLHEQPLDMDMSKISPPTSFERGEVEEHRSKKHRVESETFEQVQGPSQRQLSTRKSARLQKGAARNDEEAKYREGRGASEKKRRGKK